MTCRRITHRQRSSGELAKTSSAYEWKALECAEAKRANVIPKLRFTKTNGDFGELTDAYKQAEQSGLYLLIMLNKAA